MSKKSEQSAERRRRGYLWVDWVELGCRGWDIDHTGAELVDDTLESFAHLDRTTLDLAFGGHRKHLVRVVNDLRAAGLVYLPSDREPQTWNIPFSFDMTLGTLGTVADTGTATAETFWTHPSGATIAITTKPEGRLARWYRTTREAYLAVMMGSFVRWFQALKKLDRDTRKVA